MRSAEPRTYAVDMSDGRTCIGKSFLKLEDIGSRLILEETLMLSTKQDIPDSESGKSLAEGLRNTYGEELTRMRRSERGSKSRIEGRIYINMEYVLRVQEIR